MKKSLVGALTNLSNRVYINNYLAPGTFVTTGNWIVCSPEAAAAINNLTSDFHERVARIMANYTLKDGSPSWDGVNPKIVTHCGIDFGFHKQMEPCIKCGKRTHYSLHRKYKKNFKASEVEASEQADRLWICSDDCWKQVVLSGMFALVIPVDTAQKILGLTEEKK